MTMTFSKPMCIENPLQIDEYANYHVSFKYAENILWNRMAQYKYPNNSITNWTGHWYYYYIMRMVSLCVQLKLNGGKINIVYNDHSIVAKYVHSCCQFVGSDCTLR